MGEDLEIAVDISRLHCFDKATGRIRSHNPKVAGSDPAPATKGCLKTSETLEPPVRGFCLF